MRLFLATESVMKEKLSHIGETVISTSTVRTQRMNRESERLKLRKEKDLLILRDSIEMGEHD